MVRVWLRILGRESVRVRLKDKKSMSHDNLKKFHLVISVICIHYTLAPLDSISMCNGATERKLKYKVLTQSVNSWMKLYQLIPVHSMQ